MDVPHFTSCEATWRDDKLRDASRSHSLMMRTANSDERSQMIESDTVREAFKAYANQSLRDMLGNSRDAMIDIVAAAIRRVDDIAILAMVP